MNKRIRKKIYKKNMKEAEKIAIKKLKQRYDMYQVKSGPKKGDIIIRGLEDWKIQLQCFSKDVSIIMHPYNIIDSYDEIEAYVSMIGVNDGLFALLDDIITNKEYHLGCAWGGYSTSCAEGLKKYKDYIKKYEKHAKEVKDIKICVDKYLEELSQHKDIKEIIVTHTKGNLYEERFNIFIIGENTLEDRHEKLYMEILESFKARNINKIKSQNEIKSHLLLPGRGVRYRLVGLFIGKGEHRCKKMFGKDIYKIYKK